MRHCNNSWWGQIDVYVQAVLYWRQAYNIEMNFGNQPTVYLGHACVNKFHYSMWILLNA